MVKRGRKEERERRTNKVNGKVKEKERCDRKREYKVERESR
jgi:hypothetical protein